MIGAVFGALAAGQARWRRARNLRAGQARPRVRARADAGAFADTGPRWPAPLRWTLGGSLLLLLLGALVIGVHARWIAAAGEAAVPAPAGLAALQPALAGVAFQVPEGPAAVLEQHGGQGAVTLLVLAGMRAEPARRIDLCQQTLDPARGRLLPLRIGYRFEEAAALAARNAQSAAPLPLRNLVLAEEAMPHVEVGGSAAALRLRWEGQAARWVGDAGAPVLVPAAAGGAELLRQGWLLWDGRALRLLRRPSAACPQAGELLLQLYRPAPRPGQRALVQAYGAPGAPQEAWLGPGSYRVPLAPPPALEDRRLFELLRDAGLLRLGRDGLAELAPPDLLAWRAQAATGWERAQAGEETRRLLDRLYHHADGDFVREQVRIFNGERRLLAWRLAAPQPAGGPADARSVAARWQAESGGAPAPLAADLPAAATRLFARLPEGWDGWQRIASWPGGGERARLRLALPAGGSATRGGTLRLMLVGRLQGIEGARLLSARPACDGRACAAEDEVQVLTLQPLPGARALAIEAAPLGMDALAAPGDARYRHLVLKEGALAWQDLPAGRARQAGPLAEVVLADRRGTPLWRDGAPTEAARAAGLAPLLGVRAGHANSVAGMLGRLPGSGSHRAVLTLDLALQQAAQVALDCIAMRRGSWDGRACHGGADAAGAAAGRQVGLVLLDAASGELLAAAGSGAGKADAANWREARDFDRIDPAASPLRLPAFQHDGGAERSPGSTFKIVSALGLEAAARQDPALDALLAGRPLPDINAEAARRGYAFRTEASSYPVDGRAHITNFRDQGLDRRAQDGRLGLQQALTYSLNTWFAWLGELSDRSLMGRPEGGVPDLQPLTPGALDPVRPIVAMARRLGFGQPLRLDGGLLPADYPWSDWDALQASASAIDPVHTRHELRQMAIGLRMQATPLQMALVAAAVGEGRVVAPRLLASLDGRAADSLAGAPLGVRLDRIRAGLKGVVDAGTAAGAFRGPSLAPLRAGLYGKTGTAPVGDGELATVWFTGWLEPGSLPGQTHRLALAVFVSRSEETGGAHAAPVAAALLRAMQEMQWKPAKNE